LLLDWCEQSFLPLFGFEMLVPGFEMSPFRLSRMYRRMLKDPKTKGSRSPAKRAPPMKVVEEYLASVKKSPNPPAPNLTQFRRDRPPPSSVRAALRDRQRNL